MNLSHRMRRLAATLMLAVIAAAFVVPAAEAGNAYGHYRRWKPGPNGYSYSVEPVVRSYPARGYYYQRTSSGVAPFLVGLVGGAILGSALSQSHAHATVAASYYDPYCGISFGSLDACRSHFRGCGHPEVIRVVEGGRCTRDLCWQNGGWQDYRGGWSGDFSYRSGDGRWDRRDDGRCNDSRDPRWNDRGWNNRRGEWNDRRGDDDRQYRNRGDDGDRQYRDRDGDDDDDGDN